MTSRLRTFFEILLCVLPALAGPMTGSVRLIDASPTGRRKTSDYSGVVAWLEPLNRGALTIRPKIAQMAQRKKHFDPPVLAIPVGSTVAFPNFDPIFHNAFSNYSGQIFDVGLYPPSTTPRVVFSRSGIVRVFCNIHPTMSAVIVVADTPYITVTAADGSFRIEAVRPGDYRLHIFDEQSTEKTLAGLERTLTVGNDSVSIGVVEISESGYIQVPHKNKYGKDYPAVIEDRPYTPGRPVRR
jgi:plastocyanin